MLVEYPFSVQICSQKCINWEVSSLTSYYLSTMAVPDMTLAMPGSQRHLLRLFLANYMDFHTEVRVTKQQMGGISVNVPKNVN